MSDLFSFFTCDPEDLAISLSKIEEIYENRANEISSKSPIGQFHNADLSLAKTCYFVCKILKPMIVVETGVGHGVTSAFILQALNENGKGTLHSIDLPPLGKGSDSYVGCLIPEELKTNWYLHRGTAKQVLPKILHELGYLDIFVHDSLHTYKNMTFEFTIASRYLSKPGFIISDDMEANLAFAELISLKSPRLLFNC